MLPTNLAHTRKRTRTHTHTHTHTYLIQQATTAEHQKVLLLPLGKHYPLMIQPNCPMHRRALQQTSAKDKGGYKTVIRNVPKRLLFRLRTTEIIIAFVLFPLRTTKIIISFTRQMRLLFPLRTKRVYYCLYAPVRILSQ